MGYDLSQLPITHTATIPESYKDEMGHMNVMWYTHLFDLAVHRTFMSVGFDLDYMERAHAGSFALEFHTRFLAEVLIGETVEVRTRMLARNEKRFHFLLFMTKGATLVATNEVVGGHIDMKTRRMAPMPEFIGAGFDKLIAAHAKLGWAPPVCGSMGP